MSFIRYKNKNLFVENTSVKKLASKYNLLFIYTQIIASLKIINRFTIILKKLIH